MNVWAIEPTAYRRWDDWMRSAGPEMLGAPPQATKPVALDVRDGVAIIRIRGVLDKMPSLWMSIFGGTSYVSIRRSVNAAVADDKVSAIILSIDSPGGSVDGIAEAGDTIRAMAQTKPIIAQVDGEASSAAYYLASQATHIVAHRMDMVGSIGTLLVIDDMSRMFKNMGVDTLLFSTGAIKGASTEGAPITDEQKEYFQSLVDGYFADFKQAVMAGRNMSEAEFTAVSDGREFFASNAIDLNLLDMVSDFAHTLERVGASNKAPFSSMLLRLASVSSDRKTPATWKGLDAAMRVSKQRELLQGEVS